MVIVLTGGIFYLRWSLAGYRNKDNFVVEIEGHIIPYESMVVTCINLVNIYVIDRLYNLKWCSNSGTLPFFVSSFPLTPLFSFANNLLEICIDRFRVQNDCRRPRPQLASGIGIWTDILEVFVTVAIVSNSWVIFYTYVYVAVLSQYANIHGYKLTSDSNHLEMALFVTFVLVLLAIRPTIAKFIDDIPWYVCRQLARQKHFTKTCCTITQTTTRKM
ncbi:hypothetical protein THRCLA_03507 [Thraustotheca clavata]|uniref:Anoctamin transmembrane domain-containing protein n=1 Tax=Thraustotheca clavata TaxID=74557 RepID=A0A1W0A1T7_9STRA|nr:hypothetical protein THRCLA_03507 [Thraustotheca clavata]